MEKGAQEEHDALYKHLMEADSPVLPAWSAETIPTSGTAGAKHVASAPTLRGEAARGTANCFSKQMEGQDDFAPGGDPIFIRNEWTSIQKGSA